MSLLVAEMKKGFWHILCPKEEKRVPIYRCIGSFVKGNQTCDSLRMATVSLDGARVKCLYPEKRREL